MQIERRIFDLELDLRTQLGPGWQYRYDAIMTGKLLQVEQHLTQAWQILLELAKGDCDIPSNRTISSKRNSTYVCFKCLNRHPIGTCKSIL